MPFLLKKWGSPLIDMGVDPSRAAHELELAGILDDASEVGAHSIEDYVGWAVVESQRGSWKWSAYRKDARAIAGRGLGYVPFVWIQNLPRWVRRDPTYPRARCVEHGLECEALSVFSPRTMQLYDRFFRRMAADFGEPIQLLRVGAPNDFGETTYPVGAATFAFPDRHIHPGFWVDEVDARAHFAQAMVAKYGTIAALNLAWGTQLSSFDRLEYPADASQRRWWLDFVNWYHDAHTEKMGEILDVVAVHFPTTPLNLNLGFPDERYPDVLVPLTEGLRDVVDYDVVDERLVADGALANYRVIVWPVGFVAEAATLAQLRAWIEDGGVLVVGNLADIAAVEGDGGAFADLPPGPVVPLGSGAIFDAQGDMNQLAVIVATRAFVSMGAIPSSELLPPVDRVADGVLVSEFEDGIMLFNTTSAEVTKELAIPPGEWRLSYEGLPQQVVLPALAIRWVDGRTGEVSTVWRARP